ncbi:hypothetical protein CTA2_4162 [Colletotrichum tanaceti]|uniref:Uncharacterized protein n=1 Tax=Colletotrichum tanaceti TaxID=1306861 RepID=A0A4U6XQZ8_9PEZI|nr:hypothetical protein CTA2_4162 [Colletotrichum tanaceti]TKW58280.1 hypothetical protein CTA1_12095 [Colletotrichum tanaceti]
MSQLGLTNTITTAAGMLPYAAAGALSLAILPFTLTVMSSTNNALLAGAQGASTLGLSETTELLMRWRTLNAVRGFISLATAAVEF